MARISIFGTSTDTVYWPPVGADVFVRWSRDDDWTFIPFITPVSATETAAPSVGQATFRYDFGNIRYAEVGAFAEWLPYTINGAFIAVLVYDYYGEALLWEGVVDIETVVPHGDVDVLSGEQTFVAFDLKHMLDRRQMIGSYTEEGYVDTAYTFNLSPGRGTQTAGNKSSVANVFGVDGAMWSNLDIADYVIDNFAPPSIEWIGCGQTAGMASTQEVVNLQGATPFAALNKLIDRRRGLSWNCVSDGTGPVFIYVFSLSPISIGMAGAVVEANPNGVVLDFSGYRNVQPILTFNNLASYDTIVVRGGPITTTMSLSYADGTLQEGWTPEAQADYDAGSTDPGADTSDHDAARGSEAFDAVYSKHRLVDDWPGGAGDGEGTSEILNALPGYWPDGTPDAFLLAPFFRLGKTFMRTLPLEVEGSDSEAPQYRTMFAVVLADPEGTFDPLSEEEVPVDERVWAYADKLSALGEDFKNLRVGPGDRDLSIMMKGSPAHLAALFTFDTDAGAADTARPPQVDYTTMIATVQMVTDGRITATWQTPFLQETGRTKVIEDRESRAWYIVPGTVIDVVEGALVRHDGGWVRDDSERLRQRAVIAAAWYGAPRATLSYEFETIGIGLPVGTMVIGTEGPEGFTNVGTVVTQRMWSFSGNGCKTQVTTGYAEIDFPALSGEGG